MKLLTEDQVNFYKKNGYIVLDIFTDEEIEEMSTEYNAIFQRKKERDLDATWPGDWKKGDKEMEVQSLHGLQMHSAVFTRTLLNSKLLDSCEDVMGTPNVLFHHTKAHLKPPGKGSPYPMHQDYHYFPFKKHSMIAVFVSIDASDPENGGLCVYPGSHLLGPQKEIANNLHYYLDPKEFPVSKAKPVSLKKGQVVIFSYLLIHGSYDNMSDRSRRMFLVQLNAAEDEPLKNIHKSACQRMVLRGESVAREANVANRLEDN